ncbi:sulfatase [Actinokineospora guangxiensis]|uniref:Sulfatase n=1 Tax=Actinokineospora guangxiensis TaxID=1490288 RepID=A0ABW0EXW1_9PSEU
MRRRIVTALAAALVAVALLLPSTVGDLSPWAFLRLPVEALAAVLALLLLPAGARRPAAVALGAVLGLLLLVKALDLGFGSVRDEPFDLVLDWPLLPPAVEYLATTGGQALALAVVVAVCAAALAVVVLTALATGRLVRIAAGRRTAVLRGTALLSAVWVVVAIPGLPVAAAPAWSTALQHARQVGISLGDADAFAAEVAADRFAGRPLLGALPRHDVLLVFVESYGRTALEHPELAPSVGAVLDAGTERLAAAGYAARSGYLTSTTSGGGSWLAHATLLAGVRVDNQPRYDALMGRDRLTLPKAFQAAGWSTFGVMPGITRDWPEGAFFGYDRVYPAAEMGYAGPAFGYATMPDQYALAFLERVRRANGPLFAVVPVLSSHAPWRPLPSALPWPGVGDGSVFATMPHGGEWPQAIWTRPAAEVRADYGKSLEYSWATLVSYLDSHAEGAPVVIAVGDHQPAAMVTGNSPNRDSPITLISRDPEVLDRIADWRWTPGLRPAPEAPTWPMAAFRDRFLTAFGSAG